MPAPLRSIAGEIGPKHPELRELVAEMTDVRRLAQTALRTTEAFSNLERRNPRSEVLISTILDEIDIVLRRRLQKARIRLERDIEPDLHVVSDARFIGSVMTNVIMNAVEAIEPEVDRAREAGEALPTHRIAVAARLDGETVRIQLANDGPKIPLSVLANVFDQGVTTKGIGIGHGQGLYLCRQIAVHLGGTIGFGAAPGLLGPVACGPFPRLGPLETLAQSIPLRPDLPDRRQLQLRRPEPCRPFGFTSGIRGRPTPFEPYAFELGFPSSEKIRCLRPGVFELLGAGRVLVVFIADPAGLIERLPCGGQLGLDRRPGQ